MKTRLVGSLLLILVILSKFGIFVVAYSHSTQTFRSSFYSDLNTQYPKMMHLNRLHLMNNNERENGDYQRNRHNDEKDYNEELMDLVTNGAEKLIGAAIGALNSANKRDSNRIDSSVSSQGHKRGITTKDYYDKETEQFYSDKRTKRNNFQTTSMESEDESAVIDSLLEYSYDHIDDDDSDYSAATESNEQRFRTEFDSLIERYASTTSGSNIADRNRMFTSNFIDPNTMAKFDSVYTVSHGQFSTKSSLSDVKDASSEMTSEARRRSKSRRPPLRVPRGRRNSVGESSKVPLPFMNVESVGLIGDWEEINDNFVLRPRNEKGELQTPRGIVHFLGGAFVGAAPHLTYRLLLESIAKQGYIIVTTPYRLELDYLSICDSILNKFDAAASQLSTEYGYSYSASYSKGDDKRMTGNQRLKRDHNYLPIIGIGHSCGSLLQTLISSVFPDIQRAANVLISFNNRPVAHLIPAFHDLLVPVSRRLMLNNRTGKNRQSTSEVMSFMRRYMNLAVNIYSESSLSPVFLSKEVVPLFRQGLEIVDQVPPLLLDIAESNGQREFKPSPSDAKEVFRRSYRSPNTLILKFESDRLDQSDEIADIFRDADSIMKMRRFRPYRSMNVTVKSIPGTQSSTLTHNLLVDLSPFSSFIKMPRRYKQIRDNLGRNFHGTIDTVQQSIGDFLDASLAAFEAERMAASTNNRLFEKARNSMDFRRFREETKQPMTRRQHQRINNPPKTKVESMNAYRLEDKLQGKFVQSSKTSPLLERNATTIPSSTSNLIERKFDKLPAISSAPAPTTASAIVNAAARRVREDAVSRRLSRHRYNSSRSNRSSKLVLNAAPRGKGIFGSSWGKNIQSEDSFFLSNSDAASYEDFSTFGIDPRTGEATHGVGERDVFLPTLAEATAAAEAMRSKSIHNQEAMKKLDTTVNSSSLGMMPSRQENSNPSKKGLYPFRAASTDYMHDVKRVEANIVSRKHRNHAIDFKTKLPIKTKKNEIPNGPHRRRLDGKEMFSSNNISLFPNLFNKNNHMAAGKKELGSDFDFTVKGPEKSSPKTSYFSFIRKFYNFATNFVRRIIIAPLLVLSRTGYSLLQDGLGTILKPFVAVAELVRGACVFLYQGLLKMGKSITNSIFKIGKVKPDAELMSEASIFDRPITRRKLFLSTTIEMLQQAVIVTFLYFTAVQV